MSGELTPGQVARLSGTTVAALRFYEAKGLIVARRTAGNHRRYDAATPHYVCVVRAASAAGLPLRAIGDLLRVLPRDRPPSRREWRALLVRLRAIIDERIALLHSARNAVPPPATHADEMAGRRAADGLVEDVDP